MRPTPRYTQRVPRLRNEYLTTPCVTVFCVALFCVTSAALRGSSAVVAAVVYRKRAVTVWLALAVVFGALWLWSRRAPLRGVP